MSLNWSLEMKMEDLALARSSIKSGRPLVREVGAMRAVGGKSMSQHDPMEGFFLQHVPLEVHQVEAIEIYCVQQSQLLVEKIVN